MKPIHAGLVGLALLAGCNNDNVMAATERAYNQIQRLGNPLVSEVFLAKRSHPVHGATGPAQDVALISAELKAFVANVAGRNATVQNTLAAVLLPDELIRSEEHTSELQSQSNLVCRLLLEKQKQHTNHDQS